MSWDVVVDGRVKFPDRAALDGFRAAPLAEAPELEGAPWPFAHPVHQASVAAALAAFAPPEIPPDATFSVEASASALVFRGIWTKDTFLELGSALARTLATAARLRGRGALHVVSLGPESAWRLTAEKDRVKVVDLGAAGHAELHRAPWVADAIDRAAEAARRDLPAASEDGLGAVERAYALLAALDDDALFACAHDLPPGVSVRLKGKPIDEAWVLPTVAFPSGAALRASLFPKRKPKKRPDWQTCFALPALAVHDAKAVEPLAIEVLASAAEDDLRQSAAHALAHCPTDAAVDALFAALGTRALADFALGQNTHPGIGARALASLDAAAVDEMLAADAYGVYLTKRGAQLVRLLGAKKHEPALETLLGIWSRRGKSQAAGLVGFALIGLGHPRSLAAAATVIEDTDPALARMAARAFVKLDPATAFDRAAPYFEGGAARPMRAILEALAWDLRPPEASHPLDPRWIALASTLGAPPFVKDAATALIRLANPPEA